ncbi:hypothetical protein OG21DRAFT_1501173 [Imleria badia]|nr:hypothetical protein OG21DRAFT_1501173 [Imleria badia]
MPREHFPRQSIPTSGGVTVPSSTNVATALSLDTIASQTSDVTSVIASTSGLVGTTTTTTADPTTTASSAPDTTSRTPQTTTEPTTTAVPTTTSHSPTSSPSTTPSPTPSSSSSAPPSTTSQSPIPSSSSQGTPTTITSSYTTFFNGSTIVTQTSFPTTIPQLSNPSSSQRTAIIAGSAAGGTALLILILTLAFCARRKQFKRLDFIHALTLKRKQERSRATLLDGDDLDLAHRPRGYIDYDSPWDARMPARGTSTTRWSETGSAFREDVWPPPTEDTRLMDPLATLDLDLGRIVNDVMGPPASAAHFSDRSVSSVYRGSMVEEGAVHSRTVSNASNTVLLEAAGLQGGAGTAPVRSSPLAQSGTRPGPESVTHSTGYTP